MKALIVYGSERGGTQGLAAMIGDALAGRGLDTDVQAAADRVVLDEYDAVVVAGALYAGRWHADARRFVKTHRAELQSRQTWFVSSGPLDQSATERDIAPVPQVAKLMTEVQAVGHMTFGGRLEPDAKGLLAGLMAKGHSGDWRDPTQVEKFAESVVSSLSGSPTS